MVPVVVAVLITPDEKSVFKGPCVNKWKRRGEGGKEIGGNEKTKKGKEENMFFFTAWPEFA